MLFNNLSAPPYVKKLFMKCRREHPMKPNGWKSDFLRPYREYAALAQKD